MGKYTLQRERVTVEFKNRVVVCFFGYNKTGLPDRIQLTANK
jgi:hypothetical protein